MKKRILINYEGLHQKDLKPKYRETKKPYKYDIVSVETYFDSKTKYGIVCELHDHHFSWNRAFSWDDLTDKEKKERKQTSKKLKDNEPVDTSNWVHPDDATIRRELIANSIYLDLPTLIGLLATANVGIFKRSIALFKIGFSTLGSASPSI